MSSCQWGRGAGQLSPCPPYHLRRGGKFQIHPRPNEYTIETILAPQPTWVLTPATYPPYPPHHLSYSPPPHKNLTRRFLPNEKKSVRKYILYGFIKLILIWLKQVGIEVRHAGIGWEGTGLIIVSFSLKS